MLCAFCKCVNSICWLHQRELEVSGLYNFLSQIKSSLSSDDADDCDDGDFGDDDDKDGNKGCLRVDRFLSQIYALLRVKFSSLKMCQCKKMDQYEVWRLP